MIHQPFSNEPFTDFSEPANRAAMEQALSLVRGQLGRTYPLIIGGERITTEQTLASTNPARPEEIIGYVASASAAHADAALDAATAAFASWKQTPAADRAALIFRAADEMRRRKFELCAWIIVEASKNWAEADGDVAEAIDFCSFYAHELLRLDAGYPVVQMPGERDIVRYLPLGVGVSIPPWNFPLAIAAGMVAAPLVTGNTVVLKPSPRTPVVAAKLVEVFETAGVPPGVLNFITGTDAAIGDALVDSPKTRFISFTGSKAVGLRIYERAAKVHPGQRWLKRSILEMGGKDTQIVDETADLDAAAQAIVAAAFGFQGQKCSACSRVVATAPIYDALLQKVVERASKLVVGDASDPETDVGAVIDERSLTNIQRYLDLGASEGRLVLGGETDGNIVQPTIFADVPPAGRLSQEEIFGPVLSFIRAEDFDAALAIANNTEYGLTGGLFSRDSARLARARDELFVGNMYLNRKITGAMVGAHPFGGFHMSGTDSKAGGYDYLLLFTQAQSIAERIG